MNDDHPDSLITFLPGEEVVDVLASGTLRWVSPQCLDDPFEARAETDVDFDATGLEAAATRAIVTALFDRTPLQGLPGHPMISVLRRWRAQRRFNSEQEVVKALRMVLPAMVEKRMTMLEQVLDEWREMVRRVRVRRLFERHTEPGLWSRHGDAHRGAALRVRCDEDCAFAAPQQVRYRTRRPQVTTLAEQVADLIGQRRVHAQQGFWQGLLTRPKFDAQEHEWRCLRHLDPPAEQEDEEEGTPSEAQAGGEDAPLHEDVDFKPDELLAVYLGMRMPEETRARVIEVVTERYPLARVLYAEPHPRDFEVGFSLAGGGAAESASTEDDAGEAADTGAPGLASVSATA